MSGPQCCENPPTLSSSCGVGKVQEFGGLSCYISGPAESKAAVVLLSDIFGYEAPNLRKIAHKVAAAGFYTVVPDFFRGDPYVPDQKPLSDWVKDHEADKGCEDAKAIIAALKSRGVSKVGAAGFCWGGMVVVRLAKFDCIQAGVVLHPGQITEEEVNEVKTPISILGAEMDNYAPPELIKRLGDILSAKSEIDSFVKIFPGVGHGWTVRYNDDDEFAVKSAQESHVDMLNWLTKYIK